MVAQADWIQGELLIPDLLRAAPQVRPVLDRYGLRGCGGPLGPVEDLAFFARAHDVPLSQLLEEVRAASSAPAEPVPPPSAEEDLADAIYRPFFKAAISVVLTLGAVWGAYLLVRIGWYGSFRAVGPHEVNAHGHAQIFGWVGLFVMGFAYQAFPRFKHTTLARPRLARATLVIMLMGIVGRSLGEPLASTWEWAGGIAIVAAWLEVVAVVLFVELILRTWQRSSQGLAFYDFYVLCAMGWFVVQAIGEAVYLAATLHAADRTELVRLVATWQGALREAQIHGFALLMVLGVSQRLLPNMFGLPAPSRRLSLAALVCLNAAIASEIVGLIFMGPSSRGWAGLWYASVLVLAGTVTALTWNWGVLRPVAGAERSLKFVRAAYSWLLLSLALLALMPVYQFVLLPRFAPLSGAAHMGFSHAYYGAVRHAITVGFISLMIVGVAAKIVPTLNGFDLHKLSGLWAPFLLLNAGCALRVTAQIATDFTPRAFYVAGTSGLLEVLGLCLWGAHLWRLMAGRPPQPAESAPLPNAPITARDHVGAVLDRYPALLDTFLAFGFTPLASPLLRRTLARNVSIEAACQVLGVDVARLVEVLNAARQPAGRVSLPVVHADCC